MVRWVWVLCLIGASTARGSDLGSDGQIHFAADALFRVDFEDAPTTAAALRAVSLPASGNFVYTPMDPSVLAAHLVTDAVEGHSALHWLGSDGIGLAVIDAATFAAVAGARLEVSFWGRSEGMEPFLAVTYGGDIDLPSAKRIGWARIPAIRTGRETSDGWVEYSTGAIDGSVLDRPIHDLVLSARVPTAADTNLRFMHPALHPTDAITIDAIEVRKVAGVPSGGACTALDMDTSCGPAGECQYGRCVDSAVTWHPVPPLSMQQEIVARVTLWATAILGDRHAAATVGAEWSAKTAALASETATPKSFWGGLNQQIVSIRDSHTHLGAPYAGLSTLFAVRPSAASGPLDICFGPTVNDLGDGKLAYAIWQRGKGADAAFAVGDVLAQIDGIDPRAWVDQVFPRYIAAMPVDPAADWAPTARGLSAMLANRAKTITLSRCTGGGCVLQPPIDVAALSLAAVSNGAYATGTLSCGPRFSDLVPGARSDSTGGELLIAAPLDANTVGIEFDGFHPSSPTAWMATVDAAFDMPHGHMIVDAREGFGGLNELGDYLFQQFRGTESPKTLVLAARGTLTDPDDPALFSFDWQACATPSTATWQCKTADIFVYTTTVANPPGAASKVAWLDTDDVSNNDMVPRLLQGRPNLRIFGPFPSYGALGSDVAIPPLMANWSSGTIGASDGRLANSVPLAEATSVCQSGMGVVPDQVVTQTVSDVLAGVDTIVTAARDWLGP